MKAAAPNHPRATPWLPRCCQAVAAVLALAALGLAGLAAMSPPEALPEVAFACALLSLAVLRLSATLKRRSLAARGWVDPATGLANHDGMLQLGERMLERARSERHALTLLVLDFSDLLEIRTIYGREITHRLLTRVVRKMRALAGPDGLAVRSGKTEFAVLLPRASRDQAAAQLARVLGRPGRIEFDAGDSEIVMVPDVMAETAAPAVETVGDLYAELVRNLAEHREYERRRQHWLQRERERHSRPMSLPPDTQAGALRSARA